MTTVKQAAVISYYETGEIESEEFYDDGRLDNYGNPTIIHYYKSGKIKKQEYHKMGDRYREGGLPHVVKYYESGNVKTEIYYDEWKKHRLGDQAAVIKYFDKDDKKIKSLEYYINGELHREPKPLVAGQDTPEQQPVKITYSESGEFETWVFKNGSVQEFNLFKLFTKGV